MVGSVTTASSGRRGTARTGIPAAAHATGLWSYWRHARGEGRSLLGESHPVQGAVAQRNPETLARFPASTGPWVGKNLSRDHPRDPDTFAAAFEKPHNVGFDTAASSAHLQVSIIALHTDNATDRQHRGGSRP